ncbi:MAG TPA: SPFH domain-containing protein [Campylobacterales bacterium]|nr:SPFH domain-containing protein [Campylobacterales bacterium]
MGFWDKIFGEFIDVIDWLDESNDTMVYRFERYNNEIKYGAKLTVRTGQAAVFINEGEIADVLGPGLYELETQNLPILTTLQHWDHAFDSPFKAEVYFCNLRKFTDLKWGTKNPIILRDKEFGVIRLRAFGTYEMRIDDPALFIRDIVGTDGHFGVDDISGQLRNIIISRFSNIIANADIPVLDLASNYEQLGAYISEKLQDEFGKYGIELTKFLIENISVPPTVEEALDKRSSMGIITDLHKYLEFQTAESMTTENANSTAAMGASMGVGFAMAEKLSKNFGEPKGYIPEPFEKMYYYAEDKKPIGPLNIDEIESLISGKKINAETLLWSSGMESWKKARRLEEIESLFNLLTPPPLS